MAHNFSLRSYSCIASPPSASPASSSVVVSEISKILRPLPLPLPHPLRPCRCIQTHTACFFSCCCFCCCCCCFCCEVQMQAHLMHPPTPPELQLCPHMPLSWRGLHSQWCKHLGPPHGPLNWGRAGFNAGCNGCIPGCYCLLHIRPEADDELPRSRPLCASVWCNLGQMVMLAL